MRLQAINIDGFGALRDYSLRFPDGAVLYYGPNERGKSTVLHFLRAMFYGLGDRRGEGNLRERFTPWEGGKMGGHVWFRLGGTNYELTRTFGERKGLDQVSLTDLDKNRRVELADPEQPGAELFGLEAEVFNNSVFVEASGPGLQKTEESRRALWENLADFMISPENEVNAALLTERLSRAKLALRSAGGARGELPALEKELLRLEEERRGLLQLYDEEAALGAELDAWQGDLASLSREEESLVLRLEEQRLREDEARLRLARAPLEQKEMLLAEEAQLNETLDPFGRTPALQQEKINSLSEALGRLQSESEKTALLADNLLLKQGDLEKQWQGIGMVAGFLALFFGAAGLLLKNNSAAWPLWLIALVFLLAGPLLYGLRRQLAEKAVAAERRQISNNRRRLATEHQALCQALEALGYSEEDWITDEEREAKKRPPAPDGAAGQPLSPAIRDLSPERRFLQSRRSLWEDHQSLRREIGRLETLAQMHAESLGGQEAFAAKLKARRDYLAAKGLRPGRAEAEAAAEAYDAEGGEDSESLSRRLETVRARQRLAERRAGETKARLESLLRDPADGSPLSPAEALNENEHGIEHVRELLKEKERRRQALELAEMHLRDNLKDLRQALLPKLAERAGFYMNKMSRGRYEQMLVDDKLDILLRSSDGGHYYAPEKFSSGTEDQLYFAFRLALSDYLSTGRRMPLLLDDALVNFDDKRAREALWLLAERQVEGFGAERRRSQIAGEGEADGQGPDEDSADISASDASYSAAATAATAAGAGAFVPEDAESEKGQVLLFSCHKRLVKLAKEASWQVKTLP